MPKGVKECPKCKSNVGAKASKCKCGFSFSTRAKHKNRKLNNRAILRHVLRKIKSNDYRDHRIEHHRVTTDSKKVKMILEAIYANCQDRPLYINGILFGSLVKKINKKIGCGTVNSFRKNILINMDKMGYIARLNKHGYQVVNEDGRKNTIHQIVLTKAGLDLAKVKGKNTLRREQIHSNASVELFGRDYLNALLLLIDDINFITVKEFMYFVDEGLFISKIAQNIKRYRSLTEAEQDGIDSELEAEVRKINDEAIDKTERRDIASWENEVVQICENLKNVPGFNFSNKILAK
jgi:hypothetical protein